MKTLPHLWQRIFAYTFILVVASHIINFFIFRLMHEKDMDLRIAGELTSNVRSALQGQNLSNTRTFLNYFEKSPHQLWIENSEGAVIAGSAPPGLAGDVRGELEPLPGSLDNAAFLRPDSEKDRLLMRRQVILDSGPAYLFLLTGRRPPPPAYMIFVQGLIVVCVVGGALSLWFAWSVSRPLRRLRLEALEISEGNLDKRVSEQGTGEVLGVAQAVNRLSSNLSQNIKGMRQLLVNISHELRSPLARMSISTVIIEERLAGLLSRVQKKGGAPDEDEDAALAAKHVKNAQQEIEHMEKLISASLLNSKLDLQQQKLNLQHLDFSETCRKMAERSEALLHRKQIDFQPDIQAGMHVEGDEALLGHMLSNLIDNAVKYTPERGRVWIRLGTEDGSVVLDVENSHPGLPDEVLKHMFDPFYRGGLATGSSDGVGLGLSLVDKIALCHQGRVAARNTETGVLVRIWLPQAGRGAGVEADWNYVES